MRVIVQSLASSDFGGTRLRHPDGCNMVIAAARRKTLAKGGVANIVPASLARRGLETRDSKER
jgi:hypothetical protein